MLLNTIRFDSRQALSVSVQESSDIGRAFQVLGVERPRKTIVLIGGAGLVQPEQRSAIQAAIEQLAKAAEQLQTAVVDGGTQSGVMAAIGQARTQNNHHFPLIGIAAEGTITWPGRVPRWQRWFRDRGRALLDSNHTHFILVPGKDWGDESTWIAQAASHLANPEPSITVMINGGQISLNSDLPHNIQAGRKVLVVKGTGRAADQLATQSSEDERVKEGHIQIVDQTSLFQAIADHLTAA